MKHKYLSHYPVKERKVVKAKLLRLLEQRKNQLRLIEELGLPLKDNIKLLEQVIKGERSIENFINHSKVTNDYYHDLCGRSRR